MRGGLSLPAIARGGGLSEGHALGPETHEQVGCEPAPHQAGTRLGSANAPKALNPPPVLEEPLEIFYNGKLTQQMRCGTLKAICEGV